MPKVKKALRVIVSEWPLLWRFRRVQRFVLWLASVFSRSVGSQVIKKFSSQSKVVYVQVGANDGVSGDHVFEIFKEDPRWCGLLIEPVPDLYKKLCKNLKTSNFKFANVAIGSSHGESPFYYVDASFKDFRPEYNAYFEQVGSFSKEHIVKHFSEDVLPYLRELSVPCVTMPSILREYLIDEIDFLHIDAEGADWIIMQQIDFVRYYPKIILIEHKHLAPSDRDALLELLFNHGYRVTDYGADFFAIARG